MTRVAFGELRGEEVFLLDPGGAPLESPPGQVDILFLSRLDCEVTCLEVPPVAEHELPTLIRYRIRSVYPGTLENAAIDQVVQERKGVQVALVSIMDRAALDTYRRAAPKAVLSLLTTALLATPISRRDGPVVHWASGYVEVMRFEAGLLVESILVKRTRPSSDAQRIARLLENVPQGHPPLLIAPETELAGIVQQLGPLAAKGAAPETRPLESIDFPRRRTPFLFRQRRRLRIPRPALTRSLLALLCVLLAAGVFLRYLQFKESELASLRSAVLGSQASDQRQADLNARYGALKSRVASLIQNRPVDVFQFFADLRGVLGPAVSIQDIVLQGSVFQFQAVGPSPLSFMRPFAADPRFRDVRLLQTTPIPGTSRQQFIITGKYAR